MVGTIEISKEVSKKVGVSEAEVKRVISSFLDIAKQELKRGENIDFKGYFVLKRARKVPKMSKFCDKHNKSMDNFKRANKGKGLAAFSRSPLFRELSLETRNCSGCKSQKQKIVKSTKLLPRISCSSSSVF